MFNSYDLSTRGIYPYNPSGVPYVAWDLFGGEREHLHATDIIDQGDQYVLRIALAGYLKQNIKVKVASERLVITAEASHDVDRENKVITREIASCQFRRVYELSNIDGNNVTAKLENGILTIDLPKNNDRQNDSEREVDFS